MLLLGSCTHDGYDTYETDNTALAVQQTSGKPARTDLAYIAQQLTSSYNGLNDSTDGTLYQKIVLLDSASLYVPLFTALKPTGFMLPSTTEAQVFITGYSMAYSSLDVSAQMYGYFDTITETTEVDYAALADTIERDTFLTNSEKTQLQFIVTYLNEGGPIIDESWKKRNIVAVIKGFEKSSANAVFNVALVAVTNE